MAVPEQDQRRARPGFICQRVVDLVLRFPRRRSARTTTSKPYWSLRSAARSSVSGTARGSGVEPGIVAVCDGHSPHARRAGLSSGVRGPCGCLDVRLRVPDQERAGYRRWSARDGAVHARLVPTGGQGPAPRCHPPGPGSAPPPGCPAHRERSPAGGGRPGSGTNSSGEVSGGHSSAIDTPNASESAPSQITSSRETMPSTRSSTDRVPWSSPCWSATSWTSSPRPASGSAAIRGTVPSPPWLRPSISSAMSTLPSAIRAVVGVGWRDPHHLVQRVGRLPTTSVERRVEAGRVSQHG